MPLEHSLTFPIKKKKHYFSVFPEELPLYQSVLYFLEKLSWPWHLQYETAY